MNSQTGVPSYNGKRKRRWKRLHATQNQMELKEVMTKVIKLPLVHKYIITFYIITIYCRNRNYSTLHMLPRWKGKGESLQKEDDSNQKAPWITKIRRVLPV